MILTYENIMLDLETFGLKAGCQIISIGAVAFSRSEGIFERFEINVSPESCAEAGLVMDAQTVQWWMKQPEAVRAHVLRRQVSLRTALELFSVWVEDCAKPKTVSMWGNGSDFDAPILRAAYDAIGMTAPWAFWNQKCYRTLKSQHPLSLRPVPSLQHTALADAECQAQHVLNICDGL